MLSGRSSHRLSECKFVWPDAPGNRPGALYRAVLQLLTGLEIKEEIRNRADVLPFLDTAAAEAVGLAADAREVVIVGPAAHMVPAE